MKKGYNLCGLPSDVVASALPAAARAGFDGVEINLDTDVGEGELAEWRRLSERTGVEILGLTDNRFWKYRLSASDAAERGEAVRILRHLVTASYVLGCSYALLVPGVHDGVTKLTTLLNNSRSAIAEVLPLCEEYGVTLCIENVWNDLLNSPFDMRDFIDSFGSPRVAAYFDAGNVLRTGYPSDWIDVLGSRIKRVHIKDFKRSVGNHSGFSLLGEGDMDFPALVRDLAAIGYDGYLTTEVGDLPEELEARMLATAARLARLLPDG